MPGKGSFKFGRSKSEKKKEISRPVVVDQREIENMKKFLNSRKDAATTGAKHENVHKSLPASINKTEEELVEHPAGKYKRPILRKSTKPVEQGRRSSDNIKPPTSTARSQQENSAGSRNDQGRAASVPPDVTTTPSQYSQPPQQQVVLRKKSGDKSRASLRRPEAFLEEKVLEWPPDHWNRSPGRVRPDEFIARPISLDIPAEEQDLIQTRRDESAVSTPQQPRSPVGQKLNATNPAPASPSTPPVPPTSTPGTHRNGPDQPDGDMRQKQGALPRGARPKSEMDMKMVPRRNQVLEGGRREETKPQRPRSKWVEPRRPRLSATPPAPRSSQRRHTHIPEEALMSQSFDLGEIEHHRRRASSMGDQRKKKMAHYTPDLNERHRTQKSNVLSEHEANSQRGNILRNKSSAIPIDRHAQSAMDMRDWELYWDQYQHKKNGKNQVAP